MPKKLLPLLGLAAALLLGGPAQAQRDPHPEHRTGFGCAFDSVQQAEFARNPGAARDYQNFLLQVNSLTPTDRARLLAQPDVTVPVVVHVIHTGGTDNITDAQVDDAIRILNLDFSKTNRDTADVISTFQPIYANVGFRFRLAKLDPNGACTNGITRTYSTQTNVGDNNVKNVIRWDPDRYLNIWVVTTANGAGGYAFLPCAGTSLDGIVIRSGQFGSIGRSCGSNFCNRSLTHEVGHYFGLPHTWGGSNTPGLPSNCAIDDGIADTPNTIGSNQDCNLFFSPCGVLANVQNYMDYATCSRMFTLGQKAVMRASLLRTCRSTLVSAANLQATGTVEGYQAPAACPPVVAFRSSVQTVCAGSSVTFTDYSYNFPLNASTTQYRWSFPGGQPATSTARNPTVTYATAGFYAVSLTVTTPGGGSSTLTQPNLVSVIGAGSGETAPVLESFENPGFPANFAAPSQRNWQISSSAASPFTPTWERQTAAVARRGTAFLQVRSASIPTGTVSTLLSPNIDLSATPGTPLVSFERAYGLRNATVTDILRVQYSVDCGASWNLLATYTALDLNTQGSQVFGAYAPDSLSDWKPLSVLLPASTRQAARLQIRFQLTSGNGATLYLDDVRIGTPATTATADLTERQISVFPNPLTAETSIRFTLPAAALAHVRVFDIVGRPVFSTVPKNYPTGTHALPLRGAERLSPGVYVVQLTLGQQTYTTRVLVP